jgi:hypothetical protein
VLRTVERQRRIQEPGDAVRERQSVGLCGQSLANDDELVSPESTDGVARADPRAQAPRDFDEEEVPRRVAQAVIDEFELIDVEKQHRDPGVCVMGRGQSVRQAVEEECAIRQLGQRVMEGSPNQLLLRVLASGDVLDLTEEIFGVARVVADEDDIDLGPDDGAVGAQVALLRLVAVHGHVAGSLRWRRAGGEIVRVREVSGMATDQLIGGTAEEPTQRRVHAQVAAVEISHAHADGRMIEANGEARFRVHAVGHIQGVEDDPLDSRVIHPVGEPHVEMTPRARWVAAPHVCPSGRAIRLGCNEFQHRDDLREVVGVDDGQQVEADDVVALAEDLVKLGGREASPSIRTDDRDRAGRTMNEGAKQRYSLVESVRGARQGRRTASRRRLS